MRKNRIAAAVSAVIMAAGFVGAKGALPSEEVSAERTGACFYGDLNNDGMIDVTDLSVMSLYLLGDIEIRDEKIFERADVLYDGEVGLTDLATFRQYLSKNIDVIGKTKAVADMEAVRKVGERVGADGYMEFVCNTLDDVLLDTVDENGENNPVYSPFSYYSALAMAAECAAGTTQDEIVKALCASDIDDLHEEYKTLHKTFKIQRDESLCLSSNSVWLNDLFTFEESGLDMLKSRFHAGVFSKDYSAKEQTEKEISEWICENTENMIKPEIVLGEPDTEIMRLINTVVYKNAWCEEFGNPYDDIFHTADGSNVKCGFMSEHDNYSELGYGDNYRVFKKAMKEGCFMHFVLPDEEYSVDDIVSDNAAMTEIFGEKYLTATRNVELYVPEFEAASKFDLMDVTVNLGINEAVRELGGDFSPVIDPVKNNLNGIGARIDSVTQETVLKINQKGSEAASYTQIVYTSPAAASVPPGEKEIFRLDRPFFYYITDRNGIPVFTGIIDNPTLK